MKISLFLYKLQKVGEAKASTSVQHWVWSHIGSSQLGHILFAVAEGET